MRKNKKNVIKYDTLCALGYWWDKHTYATHLSPCYSAQWSPQSSSLEEEEELHCWPTSRKEPSSGKSRRSTTAVLLLWIVSPTALAFSSTHPVWDSHALSVTSFSQWSQDFNICVLNLGHALWEMNYMQTKQITHKEWKWRMWEGRWLYRSVENDVFLPVCSFKR